MAKFLDGFSPNNDMAIWRLKILFYIAPFLLAFGFYSYFQQTKLKSNGLQAIGTITDFKSSNETCSEGRGQHTNNKPCTKYFANITYQDQQGHNHAILEKIGDESGHNQPLKTSGFHTGQQVKVFYDPINPNIASSENAIGRYLGMSYALMAVGAIFSLVGLIRLFR